MGLFTWIVVGAIAGWLAGKVMKGRGFGLLGNIVIGVIGALVGGWLAGLLLNISNPISGFNFQTILVAFLGSIIVLYIAKLIRK
ncbi:MAG: GlsB/YeaQ/YmgE family stress response membrane protein [Chloroflexi bacterium HGW-Chloroflexi-3]|nr:MAG: GlsB/YeaQ/YmgE family stress response membrane protein [Chloroflexi bacterium HGW-Chloroflexi-3]